MKNNSDTNNKDLSTIHRQINEIKNQIIVNNKEQKIFNLMIFKENMENELNKEDLNKMGKLIENINNEIKNKKFKLTEILNKIKILKETMDLKIPFNSLKS